MGVSPSAFNLEEFGGGFGQFDPLLGNFVNQFTDPIQRGSFMEPAPGVTRRVEDLLTTGGRIPASMETYGAGLAGLPTDGAAPTQDLVTQFLKGNIAGADAPVQDAANLLLTNIMQGAGVSPEYVQAARETVFDPSMEAFRGQINRRGGGVVDPNSGLALELERRAERDFMNQMIMAGQQNIPQYLQLGLGAGQQGFGQALDTARLAADREARLGAFGEGGVTQGLGYMSQMGQLRANQQAQLAAFIRAIISGMVQPTPGIMGQLLGAGITAAPGIIEQTRGLFGQDDEPSLEDILGTDIRNVGRFFT
jgi:hypothetical protein